MDHKTILHDALRQARGDLVGKLEGAGEYDIRRPLTPTGTNLLGLVKHVGVTSLGYFSVVFDRDPGVDVVALRGDDGEDLWAKPTESRQDILDLWALAERVSDETIDALDLDSPGVVPWWPPEIRNVSLLRVLVHVLGEVSRHAGHADILRESLDGQAGRYPDDPSIPNRTAAQWAAYRTRIEQVAHEASGR